MDWGIKNRLSRLIQPDGHCFFLPIDHGYFQGPTRNLERPGETIKPLLQKLKGVGDVRVYGREREVKIWLNRDRLAAYNIGVDEVIRAVKAQHIEVPGGKVESPTKEFVVRTLGEFPTEAAFNELIVTYRQGNAIRVKDLGYAEAGREDLKHASALSVDTNNHT